jgi:AcrR family transcriptional regulator
MNNRKGYLLLVMQSLCILTLYRKEQSYSRSDAKKTGNISSNTKLTAGSYESAEDRKGGKNMSTNHSNVVRRKGSDTITEILDIALSLFVKKGYHQTSMQEIAEAGGLTKGGLYYYIKSKEDVLYLLHDRFIVEGLNWLLNVEAEVKDPQQKLVKLIKAHLEIIDNYKDDITLFFEGMRYLSPEKRQEVQSKRDKYESIFLRAIEEGKQQGIFKIADSRIAVLYILGAGNFMYTWYKPRGRNSIDVLAELFIGLVMNGLVQ